MSVGYGKGAEAPGLVGTDVDLVPISLSPVNYGFSPEFARRSATTRPLAVHLRACFLLFLSLGPVFRGIGLVAPRTVIQCTS